MTFRQAIPAEVEADAGQRVRSGDIMAWIAVAAGGAIGSVARHGVNYLVQQRWPLLRFPLATLTVNLVGCAVIGLLVGFMASGRIGPRLYWREFVFVGILGGFTTFSTFGLDTVTLLRAGAVSSALLNVVTQVGVGLLAVYLGILIGGRG